MKTSKKNTDSQTTSLESLISRLEKVLDTEIENLPTTLQEVNPEKRLDFIRYSLPLVIKYRENTVSGIEWDI